MAHGAQPYAARAEHLDRCPQQRSPRGLCVTGLGELDAHACCACVRMMCVRAQVKEASKVYGVTTLEHPAVQMISMERGKYYLGGAVQVRSGQGRLWGGQVPEGGRCRGG